MRALSGGAEWTTHAAGFWKEIAQAHQKTSRTKAETRWMCTPRLAARRCAAKKLDHVLPSVGRSAKDEAQPQLAAMTTSHPRPAARGKRSRQPRPRPATNASLLSPDSCMLARLFLLRSYCPFLKSTMPTTRSAKRVQAQTLVRFDSTRTELTPATTSKKPTTTQSRATKRKVPHPTAEDEEDPTPTTPAKPKGKRARRGSVTPVKEASPVKNGDEPHGILKEPHFELDEDMPSPRKPNRPTTYIQAPCDVSPVPSSEPSTPGAVEAAPELVPAQLTFSFEEAKAHLVEADARFEEIFARMKCRPFENLERVDPFRTLTQSIVYVKSCYLCLSEVSNVVAADSRYHGLPHAPSCTNSSASIMRTCPKRALLNPSSSSYSLLRFSNSSHTPSCTQLDKTRCLLPHRAPSLQNPSRNPAHSRPQRAQSRIPARPRRSLRRRSSIHGQTRRCGRRGARGDADRRARDWAVDR